MHLWVGVLISIIFLWLAVESLDLGAVWARLQSADYRWLAPAMLAYFLTVGGRAWRWSHLLHALRPVPARRLFPLIILGYLGNNIYPFRIGELVRAYLLRRREEVAVSASLASILAERLFDGLALLTFIFLALPFAPIGQANVRFLLIIASALLLGALLLLVGLALRSDAAIRLLDRGLWLAPPALRGPMLGIARRFLSGLISLRNGRTLLLVFASSLAIWLVETAKFWLVMQAFPFMLDFIDLMFTTGLVNLSTLLPSAPGYVGTFEAAGIFSLGLYGVERSIAGAFTVALHVALWLPSAVVGLFTMLAAGVRWRDFEHAAEVDAA